MRHLFAPIRSLLISTCVALSGSACAVADEGVISDAALAERVDPIVEAVRQAGGYPGIQIAIARGGEVIYTNGYGLADLEHETAVTAQTMFPIGSVTKSYTSLAIAQLVTAGKLDLDAPIATFFEDLPDGWDGIRVHHLMNHTSGIFNYIDDPRFHANPGRDYSELEMRAVFEAVPLGFETGTRMSYTNSGTYLLGRIIERVSGQSYPDYMQEHVLTALNLAETRYADHSIITPGKAAGYRRGSNGFVNAAEWSPSIPFSAGALVATASDVARYAHRVHGPGSLSDDIQAVLTTQVDLGGEPLQYALGAVLIQQVEGRKKISHSGDIFGYSSHFAYYPEEQISVVVLTNSQDGIVHPSSLERKLARAAHGEDQPVPTPQEFSEAEAALLAGDYSSLPLQFISPNIGLGYQGGFLMFMLGGTEQPLFSFPMQSLGGGRFAALHDDEIVLTVRDTDGEAKGFDMVFYDGRLSGKR